MPITIDDLNNCPAETFVEQLGGIFEHSPWIAELAADKRPFSSIEALHACMFDIALQSPRQQQLDLIRSHPELAGKEAQSGTLTSSSSSEQRGAGLDQCSSEELQRLRSLNQAYRERFGFPFVVAVAGLTRYDILDQIAQRIDNSAERELDTCLQQIGKIARIRLDKLTQ